MLALTTPPVYGSLLALKNIFQPRDQRFLGEQFRNRVLVECLMTQGLAAAIVSVTLRNCIEITYTESH